MAQSLTVASALQVVHAVNSSDIEYMKKSTAMLEFLSFIQIKIVVWVWGASTIGIPPSTKSKVRQSTIARIFSKPSHLPRKHPAPQTSANFPLQISGHTVSSDL